MWELDAWENSLFDQYNDEEHMTQNEAEADAWEELRGEDIEALCEEFENRPSPWEI